MTYGWAILLVAVVLAALFELGIFNHGFGASTCIPIPGFVCENPVYTANAISFTFGQNTGRDTYGDWVFIASQGEALNSGGIPVNFTTLNALPVGIGANLGLVPGQTVSVDFTNFAAGGIPPGTPVGTDFAGYVWLGYCTSAPCTAPTNYEKVATMTLVSVGGTVLRGSTPTGSISNPFNFGGGWQGAGDYYDVPGNPPGQPVYVATQSQYEAYATTTTISCPRCATTTSTSITTTASTTSSTTTTTTTSTTSSTSTTSTINICYNLQSGTCSGTIIYTAGTQLSGNVNATFNITVNNGVTLNVYEWYASAGNAINNEGTITSTYGGGNGGAGGPGVSSSGYCAGESGGAGGNGASGAAFTALLFPSITLRGGQGGAGGGGGGVPSNGCTGNGVPHPGGNGGAGGAGGGIVQLYAYNLNNTGTISVTGFSGLNGGNGGGGCTPQCGGDGGGGGGAGGGGGTILIGYNVITNRGTITVSGGNGGNGGSGGCGFGYCGGSGGSSGGGGGGGSGGGGGGNAGTSAGGGGIGGGSGGSGTNGMSAPSGAIYLEPR